MIKQDEMVAAIQLFPRKDSSISIWDHPNFKSSLALPDDYRPLMRTEEGLDMISRRRLNEEQMTVLKVVGDAMCANEAQLRRYLSTKMSSSTTSRHLKYMAKFGLVERHKCRLAFIEEDGQEYIRPPGPHTLGIGGYKLLNHLYSGTFFANPEYWQQNSSAVQRYVAMNEVRCLAVESGSIRDWSWFPAIGKSSKHKKPFAAMSIDLGGGELQLLMDRAQMSQNFLGYLRVRLEELRYLYERDQRIIIDGYERTGRQGVAISVSSESMAVFIQEQLRLHTYPFDVYFIVDEWIHEQRGLEPAFGRVSKTGVERIALAPLRKQLT